jgi:hypothetical protein
MFLLSLAIVGRYLVTVIYLRLVDAVGAIDKVPDPDPELVALDDPDTVLVPD